MAEDAHQFAALILHILLQQQGLDDPTVLALIPSLLGPSTGISMMLEVDRGHVTADEVFAAVRKFPGPDLKWDMCEVN